MDREAPYELCFEVLRRLSKAGVPRALDIPQLEGRHKSRHYADCCEHIKARLNQ